MLSTRCPILIITWPEQPNKSTVNTNFSLFYDNEKSHEKYIIAKQIGSYPTLRNGFIIIFEGMYNLIQTLGKNL